MRERERRGARERARQTEPERQRVGVRQGKMMRIERMKNGQRERKRKGEHGKGGIYSGFQFTWGLLLYLFFVRFPPHNSFILSFLKHLEEYKVPGKHINTVPENR